MCSIALQRMWHPPPEWELYADLTMRILGPLLIQSAGWLAARWRPKVPATAVAWPESHRIWLCECPPPRPSSLVLRPFSCARLCVRVCRALACQKAINPLWAGKFRLTELYINIMDKTSTTVLNEIYKANRIMHTYYLRFTLMFPKKAQ